MSINFVLGQRVAKDGRSVTNTNVQKRRIPATLPVSMPVKKEEPKLETVKAQAEQHLAEVSSSLGRKVQFNINQELDKVVVMIVDPNTNSVVKEIPSRDVQQLQIRMKQACAVLVDELV